MNILVSNDDGINASGIRHLIEALRGVEGAKIYVCAPDGQRSASGHSISTTGGPIFVKDVEIPGVEQAIALSGTPADCVKSGIKMLRNHQNIQIDVVFSGINHGSNIGTDIYYSGTVSAAIEGIFNGVPAVAVSVGTHHPTEEQLANCTTIIQDLCTRIVPTLAKDTVLNVNFPDVPPSELKGLKVCRLGPREYREQFDVVTSRAVALLPALLEYTLPLVKVGGKLIAMKGAGGKEEVELARNALKILGGKVIGVHELTLPTAGERVILEIQKEKPCPPKYPRQSKNIRKASL